jgi:hypothetical protein
LVEFVEEWQTGFFLVVGSVLGGVVAVVLVREFVGPPAVLGSFLGGAMLAFLALSYLFYGR